MPLTSTRRIISSALYFASSRIVPLSEMFGYATDLRSKTQGRGNYTMQFEHYEEVPGNIADKILGKHQAY